MRAERMWTRLRGWVGISLCVAVLTAAPTVEAAGRRSTDHQYVGYTFDWDDNLLFMPTLIHLFAKRGEGKSVTTAEYAELREHIGKAGDWAPYELRFDTRTGSFRDFMDDADPEVFLRHLVVALDEGRFGPSWAAFVKACSRGETARNTVLLSARGHRPETVRRGLLEMQRRKLIRYLPPLRNLYLVGHEKDIAGAKARVNQARLDRVQARGLGPNLWRVRDRSGTGWGHFHLWGYSDDDASNVRKTVASLGPQVAGGRWPDVKLFFYYTGPDLPDLKCGTYVITAAGTLRPAEPSERGEKSRVLSGYSCPKRVER